MAMLRLTRLDLVSHLGASGSILCDSCEAHGSSMPWCLYGVPQNSVKLILLLLYLYLNQNREVGIAQLI
jgi:hypothetical protein